MSQIRTNCSVSEPMTTSRMRVSVQYQQNTPPHALQ
jgi:hypothetical protein